MKRLQKNGVEFIGPDYGYLSCGEVGLGRLPDPNKIVQIILQNTSFVKNSL